jgi:hypothetical protein
MLLYMSHTNCQYLYLSDDQATKGQGLLPGTTYHRCLNPHVSVILLL